VGFSTGMCQVLHDNKIYTILCECSTKLSIEIYGAHEPLPPSSGFQSTSSSYRMMMIEDNTKRKYLYWVVEKIHTVEWNERACTQSLKWVDWPSICYGDVYNYLISTPSEYTHEILKVWTAITAS